jgi:hypothetical protein
MPIMRGNRDAGGTITAILLWTQRIRDHASGTGDADLQASVLVSYER